MWKSLSLPAKIASTLTVIAICIGIFGISLAVLDGLTTFWPRATWAFALWVMMVAFIFMAVDVLSGDP